MFGAFDDAQLSAPSTWLLFFSLQPLHFHGKCMCLVDVEDRINIFKYCSCFFIL